MSWTSTGTVEGLNASFYGDNTDRVMGITWKDPDPSALDASYVGFPYALRLYKKKAADTAENQWLFPYQYFALVDATYWSSFGIITSNPDYNPFIWGGGLTPPEVTNLISWTIDNQFNTSGANLINVQFEAAAATMCRFLNDGESAVVDVITAGGNSNGSVFRVFRTNNTDASANISVNGTILETVNYTFYNPIITRTDTRGYYPYTEVDPSNQGVDISADFYSLIPGNDTMYFFADASGQVFYNELPGSGSSVVPFTEYGGYLLVVQRYFKESGVTKISTTGSYLGFIPDPVIAPISPTTLESSALPYGSYFPGLPPVDDLDYSWKITIPSSSYTRILPGETSKFLNINDVISVYSQRGSGYVTSIVGYNFGYPSIPFNETYPVYTIVGTGDISVESNQFVLDLCIRRTSFPPPPWARYSLNCEPMTQEEREKLQMRRKAETLFHKQTAFNKQWTKAERFAFVAKGYNQKKKTYATQTDTYTNPNTQNLPLSNNSLSLPASCGTSVITNPSTESDVPGPVVPLTYDPSVPLVNYIVVRQYPTSEYPPSIQQAGNN